MPLISSIELRNFRGFKNSGRIALAPLTFVVGPNSAGKSTVSNALLFVAQSFTNQRSTLSSIDWMGRYVDLGSFRDTVYRHNINLTISIEIGIKFTDSPFHFQLNKVGKKNETLWKWEIKNSSQIVDKESFSAGRVSAFTLTDSTSKAQITIFSRYNNDVLNINGDEIKMESHPVRFYNNKWRINSKALAYLNSPVSPLARSLAGYRRIMDAYMAPMNELFFANFELVSSARSGPKRWVAKGLLSSRDAQETGVFNDPHSVQLESSQSKYSKKSHSKDSISAILKKLGIATSLKRVDLSAYHSSLQITDSVSLIPSNLADVGYGVSQVIPVIRGCTSSSWSPLIIEQPEIHLHPKAQSALAELICESSIERQIIVETHSEHMINRARIMVLEGKISPAHVQILYIDKISTGSKITEIGITADGEFTKDWPAGFFDERYRDTLELMALRSKAGRIITPTKRKKADSKGPGYD